MRYIDADALKTDILKKYRGNWEIPCSSEDRLIQRVVTDLRVLIEQSITADVAPKSEVAREIIDEFMSAMRVKHEENRPKYGGALALLLPDIEQIAAELKKKYTGEQTRG